MASNFRKSFNFRDGMQVATDDLVVSSNKVGVGTTAPARNLSVHGSSEFVGIATFTDAFHVGAAATFVGPVTLGSNVTVSTAGSVTAVNFYGDGATLSNLPTSQWVDTDVGLGFTSIYASGNVGVGTTDPRHTFQIAGDPITGGSGYTLGVAFDDFGNQYAAGIITANRFSGSLEATFLTGTISSARFPEGYAITGVITSVNGFEGNLIGTATNARQLVDFPHIGVTGLGATNINVTGVTTSATVHVGTSGTGFAALSTGKIGVGTALPTSDIAVRKEFLATSEVVSNKGQARVAVGQSVGVGQSTGMMRFGASANTFDVVNNSWGNLNFILHGGPAIPDGVVGQSTGRWGFVYGQTNAERMSLTYDGYLGIGNTQPSYNLDVTGTGNITSNLNVGGNCVVTGNLSAGSFSLPNIVNSLNVYNTTGVSTFANIEASATADFSACSFVGVSTLGVGTDTANANKGLTVKNYAEINDVLVNDQLYCGGSGSGIGTFAGTVTAVNGFRSTDGAPYAIQVDYASSPARIIFTVAGIGVTVLNLY